MRKHYIRVGAGLLLLLAAWRLDVYAHALADKAGPPSPTIENCPDGFDPFKARRAIDQPITPDEPRLMGQAVRVTWVAIALGAVAVVLLIKSGIPVTLSFLAWLLIPDRIRERMLAAVAEPQPTLEGKPGDTSAP